MRQITVRIRALLLATLLSAGSAPASDLTPRRNEEQSGGDTTVYASGRLAFSFPAANLDEAGRTRFALGNSFFRRNWVQAPSSTKARDGLGPHFISRSCGGCHDQGGRGAPPRTANGKSKEQPMALLLRLSVPGQDRHGGPLPEPVYGDQLATSAVQRVRREGGFRVEYHERRGRFADGTAYSLRYPTYQIVDLGYGPLPRNIMLSPRIAQQVIGVGLLEAIAEADILAYSEAQLERPDSIRGIPNRVWDVVAQRTMLGRFGWKANVGSLAHQVASAFSADMGITSSLFPEERCTAAQRDCQAAPRGNRGIGPEIDDRTLANVVYNQALLAPPARRSVYPALTRHGEVLFHRARCAICHRPDWETGPVMNTEYSSAALGGQNIHPYTDLLLHDMGEALADGRPDFQASGRQWRTPPLWGIGMIREVNGHQYLLHDGRARGILEAILWHSGEGEYAKQQVLRMPRAQREALVHFVGSL
jgi:CxxC motif-containing protein (DUF1111 family)